MMADIWDFFENMDELVYVADMDTYDMVYMNRRAMAQMLRTAPELFFSLCHVYQQQALPRRIF